MQINDKIRYLEVLAVILTGIGKFIFMDMLNWRLPYILAIGIFWIGYVWYRHRRERGILDYWGIGKTNFRRTFLELLPVGLLCVVTFVLIGNYRGTNILNWHIVPILLGINYKKPTRYGARSIIRLVDCVDYCFDIWSGTLSA